MEGAHNGTFSSGSDFCHSVTPSLPSPSYSYSDCLSPGSDKLCVKSDYSSDSGLSSTGSDFGEIIVRSSISIDIENGRVTLDDTNGAHNDTADDLIER